MTATANLPAINVNGFADIMKQAPDILQRNELSVSRCSAAGQAYIDTIEGAGGINSGSLDESVSKYIEKVKLTVKEMNDRRKPLTQLLTQVSKSFTALEAQIDLKTAGSIPARLQEHRNRYAAKKIEEQKAREEEARRLQAIESEKASYRADLLILLENVYAAYAGKSARYLNGLYDRATLENFAETEQKIRDETARFSWAAYCTDVRDDIVTNFISGSERQSIKREVAELMREKFANRYAIETGELRQHLLDRLPSKRKALTEEAELAVRNAEAAAAAAAERRQRELEDAARAAGEQKAREAEALARAEAGRQAAEAQAAFGMMSAATVQTPVKAKIRKKIVAHNASGILAIYNLWFMKEGRNLSMTELETVHKKMITFAEKEANRDGGETITSEHVSYIDEVRAG